MRSEPGYFARSLISGFNDGAASLNNEFHHSLDTEHRKAGVFYIAISWNFAPKNKKNSSQLLWSY